MKNKSRYYSGFFIYKFIAVLIGHTIHSLTNVHSNGKMLIYQGIKGEKIK
jgi:hypothetical protein